MSTMNVKMLPVMTSTSLNAPFWSYIDLTFFWELHPVGKHVELGKRDTGLEIMQRETHIAKRFLELRCPPNGRPSRLSTGTWLMRHNHILEMDVLRAIMYVHVLSWGCRAVPFPWCWWVLIKECKEVFGQKVLGLGEPKWRNGRI